MICGSVFFPRSFLLWVTTWLIISLSCFTYRHTSAWLGLSRTEARLNGFGNCLLIHLNRIHKSLPSLHLGWNSARVLDFFFLFAFHLSEVRGLFESTTGLLCLWAGQITQLNEDMEEKGLSLCSSLSLYSVVLKKALREIKWPDSGQKWRRQMLHMDMLEHTLSNATNWKKITFFPIWLTVVHKDHNNTAAVESKFCVYSNFVVFCI